MSQNSENKNKNNNNRTQVSVLELFKKLKKVEPKLKLKDIVSEVCQTFGIKETSFWKIKN
jgi:hypothetical protein